MPSYRHAMTGATRATDGRLGYPWVEAADEAGTPKALSSMTKDDLAAELEAAGLDTEGTKADLTERLRAHREG